MASDIVEGGERLSPERAWWLRVPAVLLSPRSVFFALREDEMLAEIELPSLPPGTGTAFVEVARRRGDYALMGVAALVTGNEARLAFCNAGSTPVLVELDQTRDVAAQVEARIDPPGSVHASRAFQRHLAGVLARRALQIALSRADRRP